MAKVSNQLAAPANTQSTGLIEYMAGDEKIKISPQMIRKYLVNGGGNVSDEEVMMFLSLCRYQHLNPFIRECYLIKYGDRSPATMVVGKDVHLKRAKRHPEFAGLEAGIIVRKEDGAFEDRPGTFYDPEEEKLVGGWCRVKVKGWAVDIYESVSLAEYIGKKSNGEVNGQWASKPATMIRKVAMVQALREAFPEDTAGLYVQEELPEAQQAALTETPVIIDQEEPKKEEPKAAPAPTPAPAPAPVESVEDAFFDQ